MRRNRGFSLLEILISAALVALAAMAGVAYVTRGSQHADWSKDKVFARQKALSILAELRAYVEGGEGEVAADLDGFDDGLAFQQALTIQEDPNDPGAFLQPDHPVSGNISDSNVWRWFRQISVRRFPGVNTRDLRICTVKMYRMRPGDQMPGEQMAEVSSVIRTIGDAFPTTQVYDVYLMALANVPGWWVYMDAIQPFIEATLTDLESRNPGLQFRTHWITKSGFGRDEEYVPYTNEVRDSRANTPWAYVYPGKMPAGESAVRYYVADRFGGQVNVDGEFTVNLANGPAPTEPYTDTNGNGERDPGEPYTDNNLNGVYDLGNPVPYAVADMQNHCMRYPDAEARFAARVAAGTDSDDTPTWRLLLDRMIAQPDRYHNAILINLHGELLPMPPVRNYSDAAKIPDRKPGWRTVTHPELLRPRRVAGNDSLSDDIHWRVYAYKSEFVGSAGQEVLTTQREPFIDNVVSNGTWDAGETFQDWNGNGVWDDETVISLAIPGGDFTSNPNGSTNPSITIQRLPGGIDADGSGGGDPYEDWNDAPTYPERFTDSNGDNIRQLAESFLDLDGNGLRDAFDPYTERDGDGTFSAANETLVDVNGNNTYDSAQPAESFTDTNSNGRWDAAEPYWDVNGNGAWDGPTNPTPPPYSPWDPATMDWQSSAQVTSYVFNYGEPFQDVDGDTNLDPAEPFFDANQNGVRDGGFARGEMWYELSWNSTAQRTELVLHGTPLETPYESGTQRGLPTAARLYDMDYVPCPMPDSASGSDRFFRDLYYAHNDRSKNTARWRVSLTTQSMRSAWGDTVDRTVQLETRFGTDFTTGTMWPTRNQPQNRSATYAYFADSLDDVPFSERYQYMGDPRHSPYADTDRSGASFPHGYNWWFDDLSNGAGNYSAHWEAFDASRMSDGWEGNRGGSNDVPRILSFLRTAIANTEAVYTTLTGFSYYYLSVGGDIGYDSANGFSNSIPMDGTPFGIGSDVYESTITTLGTSSISGSRKYVRSNNGNSNGIRSGGYWWSKPWLGEICQDTTYASQWVPWGNLRAATGSNAAQYRLLRAGDVTSTQQPRGTTLNNVYARLQPEGCTSLFNIGSSSSTFHHQFRTGQTGSLTEDGPELAANYNFPLPTTTAISRPFGLQTGGDGGLPDEFNYTTEYPRFAAQIVRRFYGHQNADTGSGLVRLQEPGANPRGAYIVVNGIDRTTESGSAFIARYSMLSLIHSFFAGGRVAPNRIKQLPRTEVLHPTLITELENPAQVEVRWSTEWKRWDGLSYTGQFPSNFTEDESELIHVLLYSRDGGNTWLNMRDDSAAAPGVIPWDDANNQPDPARVLADANNGGDESWMWPTPLANFPEGSYLIRIETYRASEALHYSQHMEKIYVNR